MAQFQMTPEMDPATNPGVQPTPGGYSNWMQGQMPLQPSPPTDETDFFSRMAGWKDALLQFSGTDAGKAALLRFGAAALQPIQPGQTFGGHLAGSIMQGAQGYEATKAAQRSQQIEDTKLGMERQKLGLQERTVGVQEGELEERRASGEEDRRMKEAQRKAMKNPNDPIPTSARKWLKLPEGVNTWGEARDAGYISNALEVTQPKQGGFGSGLGIGLGGSNTLETFLLSEAQRIAASKGKKVEQLDDTEKAEAIAQAQAKFKAANSEDEIDRLYKRAERALMIDDVEGLAAIRQEIATLRGRRAASGGTDLDARTAPSRNPVAGVTPPAKVAGASDKAAWEKARNSVKVGQRYTGPDGKVYTRNK